MLGQLRCLSLFWLLICLVAPRLSAAEPVPLGTRRELFVDDRLVERLAGQASLRLHHPEPRELALETSEPWEGNATNYVTVFRDGDRYRMYYRGSHASYLQGRDRPNTRDVYCYAESPDGIHWAKPNLGLFEWNGSKQNNIVWDGPGAHGFAPFRDTNPAAAPEARYKALGVGGDKPGLYAFRSADGIHWSLLHPEPVITKGAFDSLNLAFWDAERGEYREYHRDFRDGRDIRTGTSADFLHWTEPEYLNYAALAQPGGGPQAPRDVRDPKGSGSPFGRVSELYTNQITPYHRAPHLLLGFPTRYLDRGWTAAAKALPRPDYRRVRAKDSPREGTAVTDGLLITSRDRRQFSVWPESFLRPGLRHTDSWFYGDTYQNWGLVETESHLPDAPPELSLYVTERTLQETGGRLRRYSLRLDGFVSLHAPLAGGELLTPPVTFTGTELRLNVSTSAAGSVKVELQDAAGQPLPGFTLADCDDLYGDDVDLRVTWRDQADLSRLRGQPVRLRFVLSDADVFSYRFAIGP